MKLHLRNGGIFEISGIRQVVVKHKKVWYRVEGPHGIEWILESRGKMGAIAISHNDMLDYIASSTRKKNLHVWACGETINIEKRKKVGRVQLVNIESEIRKRISDEEILGERIAANLDEWEIKATPGGWAVSRPERSRRRGE